MTLRRSALIVGATAVFGMTAPLKAQTQEMPREQGKAAPLPQEADSNANAPPKTLTGEWGGLRTKLRDDGVDLKASYGSETAWNPQGGDRQLVRETGQFVFSATVDTEKLIGLQGGTFQATVTYRRGDDIGADAKLGVLQQVQEVYGRGQTWRLTQFWYQQTLLDGHLDFKLGRLTQGEDFSAFSCVFQNLSFCGSPVGNLAGDYWYNWPISQWGARARVKNDRFYAMIGAYEVNPHNLDNSFTIGHFHGATGVLVPIEIGYTPQFWADRLPGSFKIGGWINTSNANDVALDIDRQPAAVTGLSPLRRSSRYGVYAQFQQQLTGHAETTPQGRQSVEGLSVFFNITQTDRHTSVTDNQIAAGLFYEGLLKVRPKDDFEFAVARTNVNANALIGLAPGTERPNAEYAAEIDYGIHLTDWILRPNIQYVVDPGGFDHRRDVVIGGLKGQVTL